MPEYTTIRIFTGDRQRIDALRLELQGELRRDMSAADAVHELLNGWHARRLLQYAGYESLLQMLDDLQKVVDSKDEFNFLAGLIDEQGSALLGEDDWFAKLSERCIDREWQREAARQEQAQAGKE